MMDWRTNVSKKKDDKTVHSSVLEYMTYVADGGDSADSLEMRCEDENIWSAQKMMTVLD